MIRLYETNVCREGGYQDRWQRGRKSHEDLLRNYPMWLSEEITDRKQTLIGRLPVTLLLPSCISYSKGKTTRCQTVFRSKELASVDDDLQGRISMLELTSRNIQDHHRGVKVGVCILAIIEDDNDRVLTKR